MPVSDKFGSPEQQKRFMEAVARIRARAHLDRSYLCEGIDVDANKVITIDQSHNRGLDTSVERNPTVFSMYGENGEKTVKFKVYSLFRRIGDEMHDGNPLVKALKHEGGYTMTAETENYMWSLCREIAKKIALELDGKIVVLAPSTSELNAMVWNHIADIFPNSREIGEAPLNKISTEDIYDELSEDDIFLNAWVSLVKDEAEAMRRFHKCFSEMGPYFKLHSLPVQMRHVVSRTMQISKSFEFNFGDGGEIIGNDLLVIDDTVTKGHTLKEAYRLLTENFAPKSVTCLTLCSKLYNPKNRG